MALKPDDTPKGVYQPLPESKLDIKDGKEEPNSSFQETTEFFTLPKRNRDSLIDSIRRKLMPGNNEEMLRGATLPQNFGSSMSDYEAIMIMNPSLLGSQSLPPDFRRTKDPPGYEGREKRTLEFSGIVLFCLLHQFLFNMLIYVKAIF